VIATTHVGVRLGQQVFQLASKVAHLLPEVKQKSLLPGIPELTKPFSMHKYVMHVLSFSVCGRTTCGSLEYVKLPGYLSRSLG
jgi:hypothetical protein